VLLGYGPNKAFLVPVSCGATARNGNSISSDVTDDTIETIRTILGSNIFRQFAGVLDFFLLQDKNNIRTLPLNIKLICTRYDTGSLFYLFLRLVQINFIFPTMYVYWICVFRHTYNSLIYRAFNIFVSIFCTIAFYNGLRYYLKHYRTIWSW